MTDTTSVTIEDTASKGGLIASLLKIVGIAKSMDSAALTDLEQISGNIESHALSHAMPTPKEVDRGPAQAMRGGQAQTQIEAHSVTFPQDGITRMYEEFNSQMGEMQKSIAKLAGVTKTVVESVKSITDGIQAAVKAEELESQKKEETERKAKESADEAAKSATAKDAAMESAIRKARIAVRKAEDEDEKEEMDEAMEKAVAAIKALTDTISKAEDAAEDEDDEKRTEKARATLKTLKAKLKPAAKATTETTGTVVTKTSTDNITAEFEAFATTKGMNVNDLMLMLSGGGLPDKALSAPPAFMKAVQGSVMSDIDRRMEDAAENGLDNAAIMHAETIKSRLVAAKAGKYDMDALVREIAIADAPVRDIFMPSVVAA